MSDAADEIAAIAAEIAARRGGPAPSKSTARAPAFVHINGLPETFYERLVGRDTELKRLDESWSDERVNIISLVAEGGGGKSALVNEWLTRLQADGYRSADCVLGWSFYSQGSKERATAADEFLNWALAKLGVKLDTTSASAKGEAISEALMTRRALIVLDGVEPLQHGPGPQPGQLKDQGLRALLRRFAATPPGTAHSLIVLTSRLAVADIHRFRNGPAPVVDVERLSDEAGAELLRDNDVWGVDHDLRAASHDFGGHPLALILLASLIKETQNGDVRQRDHIRGVLADADIPLHDHAVRVMKSYEREWLAQRPHLLAILSIVGLFDRPASPDCLQALRAAPAIEGVTDDIVPFSDEAWDQAVAKLREVRLLAPQNRAAPGTLDAHPLVREWFGERLKEANQAAWRAAHSRLYEHLRDTTREGFAPKLNELMPLFQAISHGCCAGRYQETLDEVYQKRIARLGYGPSYYFHTLGALSSALAAISSFFAKPYVEPVAALTAANSTYVLGEAGILLRAQGRLNEALLATGAALKIDISQSNWTNAALAAVNLSEIELLNGGVRPARMTAKEAVNFADRSDYEPAKIQSRSTLAGVRMAAGAYKRVEILLADAEARHRELEPVHPFLYSVHGYRYCDLLLSKGEFGDARLRAARTLGWMRSANFVLDIALDELILGRADFGFALTQSPDDLTVARNNAVSANDLLNQAIEGMRNAEAGNHAPQALLARAAFRRAVGDWDGARRDLDEVEEIAEPGPMRLYLCDCALERARVALARREAFAPLNGLVTPSPPAPALPNAAGAALLLAKARKELDVARKLIAECGYHRRDEELAEFDAVVAGRRRFADLPARV